MNCFITHDSSAGAAHTAAPGRASRQGMRTFTDLSAVLTMYMPEGRFSAETFRPEISNTRDPSGVEMLLPLTATLKTVSAHLADTGYIVRIIECYNTVF